MTNKERKRKEKIIDLTLRDFPKIVAQDRARGREFRKRMKAFAPLTKALAKEIKKLRGMSS